jgi:uncharacterized protein YecE (DUF72 family)
MAVHIGTSGWSYDHWNGVLYPESAPPRERLDYYIRQFQTVEVNSTYYRWPAARTFAHWFSRLPDGFQMTVKAPRGLTHFARLYAPEQWLSRIALALHHLGSKRGVLLVQLPPSLGYDYARLACFLEQVPDWLRVAVEFRHASWHREETFALLERHRAAYCVMSGAYLPCILRATTSFVYARLHGPDHHHLYGGSYSDHDLWWWTEQIRRWQAMYLDVFVYFNNDGGGNAVRNARTLQWMLGC